MLTGIQHLVQRVRNMFNEGSGPYCLGVYISPEVGALRAVCKTLVCRLDEKDWRGAFWKRLYLLKRRSKLMRRWGRSLMFFRFVYPSRTAAMIATASRGSNRQSSTDCAGSSYAAHAGLARDGSVEDVDKVSVLVMETLERQ